jgi:hypothetical protein
MSAMPRHGLIPKDRRYIVAFAVKIEADYIACFDNIGLGGQMKYRQYISIIVESHNNLIAGCEGNREERSVDMPPPKVLIYKFIVI